MKFDPFAQMSKAFEAWQKVSEESFARAAAFYGEVDKLESKGIERTAIAIDELAVLQKETLAYGAQLGAEWRKLAMDSIRQASSAVSATTEAAH